MKQEPTENTPSILFDKEKGRLEIVGDSVPENGVEFYKSLLDNLESYIGCPAQKTIAVFHLDYFNISSSKMILFVLYKLMELKNKGNDVIVHWLYSDDDLLEAGTDYQQMTGLNFIFKRISITKPSEN